MTLPGERVGSMKQRKAGRNQQNGFTLVELLVGIVIILILAAVLIPNGMRYIRSAKQSAFQAEASAYLTELSGYEAEWYGKTGKDLDNGSPAPFTDELPDPEHMRLTGWDKSGNALAIYHDNGGDVWENIPTADWITDHRSITVLVDHGSVTGYSYSDGEYAVTWFPEKGWSEIAEREGSR